jgi:transposase
MVEGASVARIARAHGVNANQVFYWRMLHRKGRLGAATLLPVRVTSERLSLQGPSLPERACVKSASGSAGTIHIELRHAQMRIEGSADPAVLRVLLECLQR